MREEQVKLFRYCAEADCTECAVAGCPGPQKLLKEAAEAIEELKPRWIPVTERLPEPMHEYVLCCGGKGSQFVGWVFGGIIKNEKARAFQLGGKGRYITHWMPLPEPPKEEA